MTTYCTPAALRAELGIGDSDDDLKITSSIAAASREIDGHCGRSFWLDPTPVTREFYASGGTTLDLLDQPGEQPAREIASATGLIVKTDDGAGTFATTLTIDNGFRLLPRNATTDGFPFSEIRSFNGYGFTRSYDGFPTVQITAQFGWPAIPDDVEKACLIQAAQLFKAKDAAFGVASFGDGGALRVGTRRMNPVAAGLLERFQIVPVG